MLSIFVFLQEQINAGKREMIHVQLKVVEKSDFNMSI